MRTVDQLDAANHAPMVERGTRTWIAAVAVLVVAAASLAMGTVILIVSTDEANILPATAIGGFGALCAFGGVRLLRHARERAARPRA